MAFEAIQKVTQTEESSRSTKAEAAAQAKKIVSDAPRAGRPRGGEARRAGKARVEQARAEAEEKVKAMMAQAEELAAQQSRQVLEGNAVACEALKQEARGRLDRAADLIVGRVGKD